MGVNRKLAVPIPFVEVLVGVPVIGLTVAVDDVTAVISVHQGRTVDALKADTLACKSCWLNPAGTPEESANIWFADIVTVLFVYWSTNITEPVMTWMVVDPLEPVTT